MTTQDTLTPDALKSAISAFISGYSIESTTHDLEKLQAYPDFIPAGTSVYVAHVPGAELSEVVEMAGRLLQLGYDPVPHLAARRITGAAQLESALEQLQKLGVTHALVIAGDVPEPAGDFEGAMDILDTGLLQQYGIRTLGVSGHHEGNATLSDEVLNRALDAKAAWAAGKSLDVHIVTQFGFDTEAMPKWERETTARGITLPIHLGMAGPTSMKRLLDMGVRCGIGASLRMLRKRAAALANALKVSGPDQMITATTKYIAANPDTRLRKAHFFALGGVEKTLGISACTILASLSVQ